MKCRAIFSISLALLLLPCCVSAQTYLTKRIDEAMKNNRLLQSRTYDVSIESIDKKVSIDGTADSSTTRALIFDTVKNTKGVASVVDNVRVLRSLNGSATGTQPLSSYLEKLKSKVDRHPELLDAEINLAFINGVLTVSGFVDSEEKKQLVTELFTEAPEISDVNNCLVIGSAVPDKQLAASVLKALQENKDIDTDKISVLSVDGKIVLEGSQKDFRSIDSALATVLNTKGVRDIENRLTINGKPYK